MQQKRWFVIPIAAGIILLFVSVIALVWVQPAQAQCGSQASSCKNCHEVQGKKPVNNDGTQWHQSHAFGDFCYICHGGNQQATDETAAHTGMVDPLSDVKASCQQCHPNDLDARAKVYADILGVKVGSTSATPAAPAATQAPASNTTSPQAQPESAPVATLAPNDPNLVDYVQRYNENVLGQHATNWGNVILLVMIGAMVIGGGGMVIQHEGLVKISFKDTKPVEGEYPADVVDMVPTIAKLKPNARKSLRHLLEKPDDTSEVLTSIDKLSQRDSTDES